MSWTTESVANAVTEALAESEFSQKFNPEMKYYPVRTREEARCLQVRVVPIGMENQTLVDRSARAGESHIVSIVVQKEIEDPADNSQMAPWAALTEEIADELRRRRKLHLSGGHVCVYEQAEIDLSAVSLKTSSIFNGSCNVAYRVVREA